ncbi:MAG: Chromate transporter [Paucimonas sp.]|nr:Chromate transporter [Paucimonas sp.]
MTVEAGNYDGIAQAGARKRRRHACAYNDGMQIAPDPDTEARPRPQSLSDLFFSFTILALQGFGGVLAVVQRELVEKKRWMTREEFVEEWAVAQIMPGPNVINIALMIGGRYFGLRGAMVAVAGMLAAPLLVIMALALAYAHFASHPGVAGALRGMAAVAAGLIIATGLKLMPALERNPLGLVLCALLMLATFVAIALLRWPMVWVLPVLGSAGCISAWFALRRKEP